MALASLIFGLALWLWIIIAFVALIFIALIYYFNRFVVLSQRTDSSLAQIDVQLKKRADLVPNLVEAVKGYVKHEKSIITEVTNARKAMLSASNLSGKMKANNKLQHALKSLFAISENYPQLRANENFLQLQNELSSIEDKVAYARQHYNDSILSYNTACTTFPGNMFASLYGRRARTYLEIPIEEKAVPKISF